MAGVFAYGGGFWLHLIHSAASGGSVEAWLRDATLLVPAALIGVLVGGLLARRVAPQSRLMAVALTAVFASLAAAAAGPFYAWSASQIFAPEQAESFFLCAVAGVDAAGGGFSASTLASDLLLLLPANLLLGLVCALLFALPGRLVALAQHGRRLNTAANRRAAFGAGALAVVALSPFGGMLTVTPAAAAPAMCDASVNPARTYDVVAINVRIPYNRWGDHDPDGMMYALASDESAYKNWFQPLNPNPASPSENRRLRPRPLVIRANAGECVKITLTNKLNATQWGGRLVDPRVSMHAIGVAYNAATSDGGRVGYNPDTTVGIGESVTMYWLAPQKEGIYHFRDTAAPTGSEADSGSMGHGLFGALAVEPAGSRWYDAVTGKELYTQTGDLSGELYIDAMIAPPNGQSFRESIYLSQDENPTVNANGLKVLSYGFNYGTEPEHNRDAERCPDCLGEETSLSSWVYGDPAAVKLASGIGPWRPSWQAEGEADPENCGLGTPGFNADSCWTAAVTRAYRWDRYKLRFGMATSYETHIFHLHANQWKPQPDDTTSTTIDSQTFGPGDAFTADLLGGAGSFAGTVGDSIFHCHLYPHFAEGFWALLRVHDTLEDGSKVNPDGIRVPALAQLPGAGNLEGYVPPSEEQLGRPGYPRFIPGEFGWRAPQPPLGISEQRPENLDADASNDIKDDPTTLEREDLVPSVRMVAGKAIDGVNVDPAFVDRVAIEQQAMTAIYNESAAVDGKFSRGAPKPGAPFADPCPVGTREVTYNVSIIQTQVTYNDAGWFDSQARFLILDETLEAHKDEILAGTYQAEPLFFRINQGDCVNFNLTNRLPNWFGDDAFVQLAQTNMMGGHIHLVKFDVLASDGSSNGWNYQQAAYTQLQTKFKNDILTGDASCSADEATSACRIPMSAASNYTPATQGLWPGQTLHERWWADTELRTIFTHDHHFAALDQNRGQFGALLVEPAGMDFRHPNTGEFYQPINQGGNGPVCGSACNANAAGTKMDVIGPGPKDDFREFGLGIQDFVSLHKPTAWGNEARLQDPAFAINPPKAPEPFPKHNPGTFSVNYRNSPLQERRTRNGQPVDPAYVFSSTVWGDPETPLLEAYAGDPVRFRLIQGSQEEQHTLTIHGMKWRQEPDDPESQYVNSATIGISEAFNAHVPGMSCGWDEDCQGDYLYSGGSNDDIYQGLWGIFRVYGRNRNGLLPLPDTQPQNMQGNVTFKPTGNPPPPANRPGTPCVPGSPTKYFTVVAHNATITYNEYGYHDPYGLLYTVVRPGETFEQAMARNAAKPEPMVLRANEGDCIEVSLHNRIDPSWLNHGLLGVRDGDPNLPTEPAAGTPAGLRVSLHASLVQYDVRGSDGATVGYNKDQTVGPGENIVYRWFADDVTPGELGAISLTEYGDVRGHRHHGLLAGLVIGPRGATYHDPVSGAEVTDGAFVDVRVAGQQDWRDLSVFYQDGLNLRKADGSFVLDPETVKALTETGEVEGGANPLHPAGEGAEQNIGEKGFNYGSEPLPERLGRDAMFATVANPLNGRELADLFSSWVHGDPATPILRAYAGDPVRVRLMQTSDRPRQHIFQIGGHGWLDDPWDANSRYTGGLNGVSVPRSFNLHLPSAGSALQAAGDYRYGSAERTFFESQGLWGIFRVYSPPASSPLHTPSAIEAQDNPYTPGYAPLLPLELATVSATVYGDQNMNAARGNAEGGVAGITVRLKDTAGGVLASNTTDADGNVSFNVRRGVYDLEVVAPAGYSSTSPALLRADVQAENSRVVASYGLAQLVTLTASVINDLNGDGLQDLDESALAGWTVRLHQGNTLLGTAVSAVDGSVSFPELKAGSYKLSAVAPGGWFATTQNPVAVGVNGEDVAVTLGFAAKAGLSVALFNDANQSNGRNSGERNLSDWKVTISGGPADLEPVAITGRTGLNGAITFDNPDPAIDGLLPGVYNVTIAAPRDWRCIGTGVSVNIGLAGATSSCKDNSFTTELLAGTSQNVSLAYYTPNHWVVAEPFNDLNRNGVRDTGEGKLVGWTARLKDAAGNQIGQSLTGNDGRVTWTIKPGSATAQPYSIELTAPTAPAGSIQFVATGPTIKQLSVQPGDTGVAQVGFVQTSSVGVRVFEDHDQDGVWDSHEGALANRNVVFYDRNNATVLGTATTDANGMAAFKMTAGRTYYLEVLAPTSWKRTAPVSANGAAIARLKVVAPTSGAGLEVTFGQYNTLDTTPPPAPTLNTNPGSYDQALGITVDSESNVRFRYTLDGTEPTATTGYPLIDPMITVAAPGVTTLKVVAIDKAGNISPVTTGAYTITYAAAPIEASFITSVKDWSVMKGGIAAGYSHWMAYLGDGLQMTPRTSRLWDGAKWMHMSDGYGSLTLPAGQRSLASIEVTLTDKHSRVGAEQHIYLYNYLTGQWDSVLGPIWKPDLNYATEVAHVDVDAGNYVDATTGEMRVRVYSFLASASFTDGIDRLTVRTRYIP